MTACLIHKHSFPSSEVSRALFVDLTSRVLLIILMVIDALSNDNLESRTVLGLTKIVSEPLSRKAYSQITFPLVMLK